MDTIVQFIAQVGFPIVAFLLMWKELGDERQSHEAETARLAEVIGNNTTAIVRLTEKLESTAQEGKH